MRATLRNSLTCCWPGLSRLWLRGDWTGLIVAIAFAGTFNLLVLFTYIWPESLPISMVRAGWCGLVAAWLVGFWRAYRLLPELLGEKRNRGAADLFPQAQTQYLRGHWFEAEKLLNRLLTDDPRDVDARLLLATLFRRTQRIGDARRELQTLSKLAGSAKWALEIEQERRLLDRLVKEEKKHHYPEGADAQITESTAAA